MKFDENVHFGGEALSAILLKDMILSKGKSMPEIPPLDEIEDKDYDENT